MNRVHNTYMDEDEYNEQHFIRTITELQSKINDLTSKNLIMADILSSVLTVQDKVYYNIKYNLGITL